MKHLLLILLFLPLFGLSQETYKGLVLPTDKYPDQVIMLKANGDTTHVWPPKFDWHEPYAYFGTENKPPRNSVFYFWEQYLADCNTLVSDTIQMEGVIHCKWKLENGKYVVVPKDTIWKDYKKYLKQYKYEYEGVSISGTSWSYSVNGQLSIGGGESDSNNNLLPVFKDFKKHIYWIKKRPASWDDFWNRWLVEKKIIELN